MPKSRDITRREFVADAGSATLGTMVAAGAPLIVPRRALGRGGRAPSDIVSLGIVGFGGMGCEDALVLAQTEHIAAVCDVEFAYSEHQLSNTLTGEGGKARPEGLKLQEQFHRLLYDGERGQVTNVADANQFLTRQYRAGWAV